MLSCDKLSRPISTCPPHQLLLSDERSSSLYPQRSHLRNISNEISGASSRWIIAHLKLRFNQTSDELRIGAIRRPSRTIFGRSNSEQEDHSCLVLVTCIPSPVACITCFVYFHSKRPSVHCLENIASEPRASLQVWCIIICLSFIHRRRFCFPGKHVFRYQISSSKVL